MSGISLQELGLTGSDASDLAASLIDRINITEATATDESLVKYTCLTTALSAADWRCCLRRNPDLLSASPETLAEGLNWLQQLFQDNTSILVDTLLGCPGLLQQDKQEIDAKIQLLQQHHINADGRNLSATQIIARLASHAPHLLCQPSQNLQAKINHLAAVLSTGNNLAAQMVYDVPSIAEYLEDVTTETNQCGPDRPVTLLEQRLDEVEKLLSLDGNEVRKLLPQQPDLLIRSFKDLQLVSGVLEELFGCDKLAQVVSAAPSILCMDAEAVKARSDLLHTSAQLQPSWHNELAGAPAPRQAVWLASSESRLRRLEVAASSKQLSQLSMHELLSLSEDSWSQQATAAGVGVPDNSADLGTLGTNQSQEARAEQQHSVSQEPCIASSSADGQVTALAPVGGSAEEAAPAQDSQNSPNGLASQLPQPLTSMPSDLTSPTNVVDQQPDGSPVVEAAVGNGADVEGAGKAHLLEVGGSAVGGDVTESAAVIQDGTAGAGDSAAATQHGRRSIGESGAAAAAAAAAEKGAGTAAGLSMGQHEAVGQQDPGISDPISMTSDSPAGPADDDGSGAAAAALPVEPVATLSLSEQSSPAAATTHAAGPVATVATPEQALPGSAAAVSAPAAASSGESTAANVTPCLPQAAPSPPAHYLEAVPTSPAAVIDAADEEPPSSQTPSVEITMYGGEPTAAVMPSEQDLPAPSAAVPAPAAAASAGKSAAAQEPRLPLAPPAATPLVDGCKALPPAYPAGRTAADEERPRAPSPSAALASAGDVETPSTSDAGPGATSSHSQEPSRAAATAAATPAAADQSTSADSLAAAQPCGPNRSNNSTSAGSTTTTAPAKATSSSSPAAAAIASKSAPTSSARNIEAERREAFMSKLLAQVPTYAVTLLGTDQADKLLFLSHMAPADLSAVLAQPNSEELLEAVYAVHLKKQQQQQQGMPASAGQTAADRSQVRSGNSSNNSDINSTAAGGNAAKSSAASAAAGSSKSKASTSAASTPSKPAVSNSNADVQQQPAVATDRSRKYLFVDGPVCSVCGSKGHLGADCRTSRCDSCQQVGHPPGKCSDACRVCGKRHRPGPCSVPLCDYCKLYGHLLQHCPTAHCKKCDHYGHVPSLCPVLRQQQTAAGAIEGSSSKSATLAALTPAAAAGMAAFKPATAAANGDSSSGKLRSPAAAAAAATTALQPSLGTLARPAAPPARNAAHPAVRGMVGRGSRETAGTRAAPAAAFLPAGHEWQQPTSAAAQTFRHPTTNLTTYPTADPVRASAAAPATAVASSPSKGILVEDGGKAYLFVRSVVCSRCGKPGHLGSLCETSWCGSCRVFGHRYGECEEACYTCGRKHAFTINGGKPVCYTSRCNLCNKFSHSAEDCPAARCSECGYYGHTRTGCPAQQRQQGKQMVTDHQLGISTSLSSKHYSTAPEQASGGSSSAYNRGSAAINSSYSIAGAACPLTSTAHGSLQIEKPASGSRASLTPQPPRVAAVSAAPAAVTASQSGTSTTSSLTSKWITLVDSGTHYKCHQYPACTTCGTVGHLSSTCKTPFCSGCGKFGHLTNRCHSACQTCGKQHDPGQGGCYMPLCPACMLYGHIGKHCPSAQCSICGYFGHAARICPDKHLLGQPAGSGADAALAASIGSSSRQQQLDSSRTEVPQSSRFQPLDTSRRVQHTGRAVGYSSSSNGRGLSQQDGWGETAAGASRSSRSPKSDAWGDSATGTHSGGNRSRPTAPKIQGKQYRFLGAPACDRCGRTGHIGAECHADFCQACQKWGHETGSCTSYCRRCGKNHARGGCIMPLCPHCQLWGHSAKHCPAVQCTSCGHWGHSAQLCPVEQQPGSRAAQGSGSAPSQGNRSDRAAQGKGSEAAAAAAQAITGRDGGWSSDINAAEDSCPDRHASNYTFNQSSNGWGNGGAVVGPAAAAAGSSATSRRGGPTAQFILEPPAASGEEDKARGARLVHTLFASLPQYASTLMGDKEKLSYLSRLTPADLQYILAQKHPDHLLDAVHQAQQQKRQQTAKVQQQMQQPPEHRRGEAMAGPQARFNSGGPARASTQQAGRAVGAGTHARIATPDAGIADNSSILMQQMAATLAGFKQLSGKQHSSESPMAGARVKAGEGAFGLRRGFSAEDDDMSDMLGLLGVQHP